MNYTKLAGTLLIMAILLICVSGVAFAESGKSDRGFDDSDNEIEDGAGSSDATTVAVESENKSDDRSDDSDDELNETEDSEEIETNDSGQDSERDVLERGSGRNGSDSPRAVEIRKETREALKERLKALKENLHNARESYKNAREEWNTAKNHALEEKKNGTLSLDSVKSVLSRELDLLLGNVATAQSFIQNDALLSEEKKTELLAKLDEQENWLVSEKEKLDAATTREELKDIQKEVREKWNELKKESKRTIAKIGAGRVGTIIETAHKASLKLHERLDAAKAEGKDVLNQEAALLAFDAGIESAQLKFEEAKAVLENAKNAEDFDAEVRKGMELAKEAHELLKEAYADLRDSLQGFRSERTNRTEPAPPAVPEGG